MRQRRKSLVCQHVERLSSATLETYSDMFRNIVGRRHGVYALYRKGKLYYVGLASNLRSRLNTHLKDRHKGLWDQFSVYLTIDDSHLRELESLVLRIAQPKGNKQTGKFARSVNVMKEIRARVREQQRNELDALGIHRRPVRTADAGDGSKAPPLAKYIRRPLRIRARSKGKVFRGTVRRDGRLRVNKQVFDSPSSAGKACVGRSVNGWALWEYEHAPNLWLPLKELRRR